MIGTEAPHDTIVAVSSAAGAAPRGIVRLSGPKALAYAQELAGELSPLHSSRRTYFSFSVDLHLDGFNLPARAYVMRAPASYTREDIVEFHCIGNPTLLKSLLGALQALGARPAGPGEFTRRAFLNGRLDLAQAEAVETLIHAHDEAEYRAAQDALSGTLSRNISAVREQLAELAAIVEVSLDFSDQDVEIISHSEALNRLRRIERQIESFGERPETGRVRREAVRVAFYGPPNAGKSSLFNALLERRRAIVSPHPGTTRDTIEAVLVGAGFEITLVDTAGLRPAADEVEAVAVGRSRRTLRDADLALCVLDASAPPSGDTREAVAALPPGRSMILLNKSDLASARGELRAMLPPGVETLEVSAETGHGLPRLLARIRERVEGGLVNRSAAGAMVSARQVRLLQTARDAILHALSPDREPLMELLADDLRGALAALSELTGDAVTEDVLDRIFSTFCIGK